MKRPIIQSMSQSFSKLKSELSKQSIGIKKSFDVRQLEQPATH